MKISAETLIEMIRAATSLEDLQRAVGASDYEEQQNTQRLAEIDRIGERYDFDTEKMPYGTRERYQRLWAEQNEFESRYR